MIAWETDLSAFVLDILSFIEEQIELARQMPNDQVAAVDVARGAIPMLRERVLGLDDPIATTLLLVFSERYEGHEWEKSWSKLASLPATQFQGEADKLLQEIAVVKTVLRGEPCG